MTTPKLSLPELSASQSQKEVTHNEALWQLDALAQPSVKDRDLTAPPGSPVSGDCYIVGASATEGWATHDNEIAQYKVNTWVFYTPNTGWRVFIVDEAVEVYWTGSAWTLYSTLTHPYIVAMYYQYLPGSSATLGMHLFPDVPATFSSGLSGSTGAALGAATAQTVFSIEKNGSQFGTATFAASATTATFAAASDTSFASGDRLTIVAPSTPDATLSGISITLKGYRT